MLYRHNSLVCRIVEQARSPRARIRRRRGAPDDVHVVSTTLLGFSESAVSMRQVLIYRGEDEQWVAECPSLPGCISQEATREEAITNIREAVALYLETISAEGLKIPEERFDALLVAV